MGVFRLRTFGGAGLEHDGRTLDAVSAQRKALALLVLLASARDIGISRDRVIAYLWPESSTDRARGALKQTLHVLRRQLDAPDAIVGTTELRLNPERISSDIDDFLRALEGGEPERAAHVYQGPFLDGFHLPGTYEFEEWVAGQRDQLAQRYRQALDQLGLAAEQQGDVQRAIYWWRRAQAEDPLSGAVTLKLMRLLHRAGERAAAIRVAQTHEQLLQRELHTTADPEVAEYAARLRAEGGADRVPVVDSTTSPSQLSGSKRTVHEGQPPRRYSGAALTAGAAMLGLLAVLLLVKLNRNAATEPSIAVLPFTNPDGDPANEHIAFGFAESLTDALGKVSGLRVAARGSGFALKRRGIAARDIADSLGVETVLDGAVRRVQDQFDVSVRLIDGKNGEILWSKRYQQPVARVFEMQEDIARQAALQLAPRSSAQVELVGTPTHDLLAYDLYLRARHHWRRRTREGIEGAITYYEQALERDPSMAIAYAGLAEAYINSSNFGYRNVTEALARAEVAAQRAIAKDSTLAEAHATHGFVLASRLRLRAAEQAFQRAIALNPSYAWTHHYYTLLLLMQDRTDEAREHNRTALSLDPLSLPANATRGIILCQRRDFSAAGRELHAALAISPDFALILYYLGVVRSAEGRHDEAFRLLQQAHRAAPDFTGVPGALAWYYRRQGRDAAVDSVLAALTARSSERRSRMNLALTHAALGDLDRAFALLDQVEWDVPSLIELRADPLLNDLRADRRYSQLIERLTK